jgi:hypothetical protein
MQVLTDVLAIGLLGVAIYGATKSEKYKKRHADDPISHRTAELSMALWSVALAIPVVVLVYMGWAIDQGFVAFSDVEIAAYLVSMAFLAIAGSYLSRGRTPVELLRRRKEWR